MHPLHIKVSACQHTFFNLSEIYTSAHRPKCHNSTIVMFEYVSVSKHCFQLGTLACYAIFYYYEDNTYYKGN